MHNYPIYKKSSKTGAIIKFSGLTSGEVAVQSRSSFIKGHTGNSFVKHDDPNYWEDVTAIADWLACLPAPYDAMALKNREDSLAKQRDKRESPVSSLSIAISGSFVWERTPEGHKFWEQVKQWANNNGELPPVPAADGALKGLAPLFYTEMSESILKLIPEGMPGRNLKYIRATVGEQKIEYFGTDSADGTKLSTGEFAAKILDFKPAWTDKTLDFLVEGYQVKLRENNIRIGCKSITYPKFAEMMKELEKQKLSFRINDDEVEIEPAAIKIDGYRVTLEELQKIEAAARENHRTLGATRP